MCLEILPLTVSGNTSEDLCQCLFQGTSIFLKTVVAKTSKVFFFSSFFMIAVTSTF